MLKRIAHTNIPRLALGLCLLALALCQWPSQSALAQDPASGEPRYCTWLFWSKEPALIKQALERMALGDPFMVVAREVARRNPKDSQANADCMQASGMDPAVLAVVKNLKIGEISRPFDLGGGTALVMRTTDEHRRKAQEFYSKGRYSQAERELLRDLKLHPASSAAWHMLALTRTAQGNYKQALDALNKALVWSPGNSAMLNDKASALANLGRSKQAVAVFEEALKLDPKNPTIMSNLAWALSLARKKPKRAEALARQACDEAPEEARFWHTLGKVQAAQGNHGKSVVSFRQALLLAPKNKAASQDLIKSIKALDPKVLARLSQDAPSPAPKPAPKAEPKDKTDNIGKGLKPAPDLSGPAIALPSQWPTLPKPKAKAGTEPKAETKTAAKDKSAPKPQAKAELKAAPPVKTSSEASGRIVSLPMPKFPEPLPAPPAQTKDETPVSHDRAYKSSSLKANKTKAAANQAPAKAGQASAKADNNDQLDEPKAAPADKPKAVKPKPEPQKTQAKAEPAKSNTKSKKTKPTANAKPAVPAKPKAVEPESKPAKAEIKTPEAKPAEKVLAKAAPAKPKPMPKEPAKVETKPGSGPSKEIAPGTPHYLIQVASYRPESLAKKELRAWQRRKIAGHIETWQDKRGRTWHRVLLGPFADQKAAENKAEALKAKRLVRDYYVVKRPAD